MVRSPSVRVLRDRSTCSSRSGRWHATLAAHHARAGRVGETRPTLPEAIDSRRTGPVPGLRTRHFCRCRSLDFVVVTAAASAYANAGADSGAALRSLLLD